MVDGPGARPSSSSAAIVAKPPPALRQEPTAERSLPVAAPAIPPRDVVVDAEPRQLSAAPRRLTDPAPDASKPAAGGVDGRRGTGPIDVTRANAVREAQDLRRAAAEIAQGEIALATAVAHRLACIAVDGAGPPPGLAIGAGAHELDKMVSALDRAISDNSEQDRSDVAALREQGDTPMQRSHKAAALVRRAQLCITTRDGKAIALGTPAARREVLEDTRSRAILLRANVQADATPQTRGDELRAEETSVRKRLAPLAPTDPRRAELEVLCRCLGDARSAIDSRWEQSARDLHAVTGKRFGNDEAALLKALAVAERRAGIASPSTQGDHTVASVATRAHALQQLAQHRATAMVAARLLSDGVTTAKDLVGIGVLKADPGDLSKQELATLGLADATPGKLTPEQQGRALAALLRTNDAAVSGKLMTALYEALRPQSTERRSPDGDFAELTHFALDGSVPIERRAPPSIVHMMQEAAARNETLSTDDLAVLELAIGQSGPRELAAIRDDATAAPHARRIATKLLRYPDVAATLQLSGRVDALALAAMRARLDGYRDDLKPAPVLSASEVNELKAVHDRFSGTGSALSEEEIVYAAHDVQRARAGLAPLHLQSDRKGTLSLRGVELSENNGALLVKLAEHPSARRAFLDGDSNVSIAKISRYNLESHTTVPPRTGRMLPLHTFVANADNIAAALHAAVEKGNIQDVERLLGAMPPEKRRAMAREYERVGAAHRWAPTDLPAALQKNFKGWQLGRLHHLLVSSGPTFWREALDRKPTPNRAAWVRDDVDADYIDSLPDGTVVDKRTAQGSLEHTRQFVLMMEGTSPRSSAGDSDTRNRFQAEKSRAHSAYAAYEKSVHDGAAPQRIATLRQECHKDIAAALALRDQLRAEASAQIGDRIQTLERVHWWAEKVQMASVVAMSTAVVVELGGVAAVAGSSKATMAAGYLWNAAQNAILGTVAGSALAAGMAGVKQLGNNRFNVDELQADTLSGFKTAAGTAISAAIPTAGFGYLRNIDWIGTSLKRLVGAATAFNMAASVSNKAVQAAFAKLEHAPHDPSQDFGWRNSAIDLASAAATATLNPMINSIGGEGVKSLGMRLLRNAGEFTVDMSLNAADEIARNALAGQPWDTGLVESLLMSAGGTLASSRASRIAQAEMAARDRRGGKVDTPSAESNTGRTEQVPAGSSALRVDGNSSMPAATRASSATATRVLDAHAGKALVLKEMLRGKLASSAFAHLQHLRTMLDRFEVRFVDDLPQGAAAQIRPDAHPPTIALNPALVDYRSEYFVAILAHEIQHGYDARTTIHADKFKDLHTVESELRGHLVEQDVGSRSREQLEHDQARLDAAHGDAPIDRRGITSGPEHNVLEDISAPEALAAKHANLTALLEAGGAKKLLSALRRVYGETFGGEKAKAQLAGSVRQLEVIEQKLKRGDALEPAEAAELIRIQQAAERAATLPASDPAHHMFDRGATDVETLGKTLRAQKELLAHLDSEARHALANPTPIAEPPKTAVASAGDTLAAMAPSRGDMLRARLAEAPAHSRPQVEAAITRLHDGLIASPQSASYQAAAGEIAFLLRMAQLPAATAARFFETYADPGVRTLYLDLASKVRGNAGATAALELAAAHNDPRAAGEQLSRAMGTAAGSHGARRESALSLDERRPEAVATAVAAAVGELGQLAMPTALERRPVVPSHIFERYDSRTLGEAIVERIRRQRELPSEGSRTTSAYDLRGGTEVQINLRADGMLRVLDAGEYLNQFQLPIDVVHELQAKGKGSSYNPSARQDVERKIAGLDLESGGWSSDRQDPRHRVRPKYGYLDMTDPTCDVGRTSVQSSYGDIALVLRENVKDRTTWVTDDSFETDSEANHHRAATLDARMEHAPKVGRPGKYFEAQIWGEVGVLDISEVLVAPGTSPEVLGQLRKAGIPVYERRVETVQGRKRQVRGALLYAGDPAQQVAYRERLYDSRKGGTPAFKTPEERTAWRTAALSEESARVQARLAAAGDGHHDRHMTVDTAAARPPASLAVPPRVRADEVREAGSTAAPQASAGPNAWRPDAALTARIATATDALDAMFDIAARQQGPLTDTQRQWFADRIQALANPGADYTGRVRDITGLEQLLRLKPADNDWKVANSVSREALQKLLDAARPNPLVEQLKGDPVFKAALEKRLGFEFPGRRIPGL